MATVTGVTAARAQAIEDASVVGASIQGNDLVLVTHDGTQINVGRIIPPLVNSYPVGSIYMTDRSANPSTYMGGGTWVRWGKGRVPVSLDEADGQFDTVEETGGAKTHVLTTNEMPSHTHGADVLPGGEHQHYYASGPSQTTFLPQGGSGVGSFENTYITDPSGYHDHGITISASGGGAAHNNLPPYITCYMWKRTA